jgi:hypothetical protein
VLATCWVTSLSTFANAEAKANNPLDTTRQHRVAIDERRVAAPCEAAAMSDDRRPVGRLRQRRYLNARSEDRDYLDELLGRSARIASGTEHEIYRTSVCDGCRLTADRRRSTTASPSRCFGYVESLARCVIVRRSVVPAGRGRKRSGSGCLVPALGGKNAGSSSLGRGFLCSNR